MSKRRNKNEIITKLHDDEKKRFGVPTITIELHVIFEVLAEKDGKQNVYPFAVRDMTEQMILMQKLTELIAHKTPLNEIGHPLCGCVIHGYKLSVETMDNVRKRLDENETIHKRPNERENFKDDSQAQCDEDAPRLVNLT